MKHGMTILLLAIFSALFHLPASAQEQHVLAKTPKIPGNDTVWVYKPATYEQHDKFPLLFLLHGYSGKYSSWHTLLNMQELSDTYNFILVCPDGFFDSYYLDSPLKNENQYASFFFETLLPYVHSKFKTDTSRVFITGLSMGGHGAIYLYCEKPELFAGAASSSGVLDLNYSSQKDRALANLFGPYAQNKARFDAYSAVNRIKRLKGTRHPIYFDCGTEDFLYQANKQFRDRCDQLGLNATFLTMPGTHDASYWKKAIPRHFDFFQELCKTAP